MVLVPYAIPAVDVPLSRSSPSRTVIMEIISMKMLHLERSMRLPRNSGGWRLPRQREQDEVRENRRDEYTNSKSDYLFISKISLSGHPLCLRDRDPVC